VDHDADGMGPVSMHSPASKRCVIAWAAARSWASRRLMEGLLVDGVDRHLRDAKEARIIERPHLQDHGR
jgi:hypothetical protein